MLGQWSVLLHGLALGGLLLAALLALLGFAVERLRHRCRTAEVADAEDLDVEIATFVLDAQHVADVNITGWFGLDFVGPDAADVTGLRCQGTRFEKARRP